MFETVLFTSRHNGMLYRMLLGQIASLIYVIRSIIYYRDRFVALGLLPPEREMSQLLSETTATSKK